MKNKGIDVSYHNGNINWNEMKNEIDFAMLRAGYGKNNIDSKFHRNATECSKYSIPFGVYWFSYAYNEKMAIDEANYCCDAIANYNLLYPVAFDYEYGSEKYAEKYGIKITKDLRVRMADNFLKTVEDRGYYPILYTNEDYIKNRGFDRLLDRYDIWYARYNNSENPARDCAIWQYGTREINGIKLDANWGYKDYPSIINPYNNIHDLTDEQISTIINNSDLFYVNRDYINLAFDIIDGKYGVGKERKIKVESLGYDYNIAQSVVNAILHYVRR